MISRQQSVSPVEVTGRIKIATFTRKEHELLHENPEILNTIHAHKSFYRSYEDIREEYPNTYPPLELDVAALEFLYYEIYPYFKESENMQLGQILLNIRTFKIPAALKVISILLTGFKYDLPQKYAIVYRFPSIIEQSPEEKDFFSKIPFDKMVEDMTRIYESAGFVWNYFMFYNMNSPATQAYQGKVALKPDIFEGFAGPITEYPDLLGHLKKNRPFYAHYETNRAPFIAWRKKDLVDAIKKSGLWEENPYSPLGMLPRTSLGIPAYLNVGGHPGMPGFQEPFALRLGYYETIYRLIFDTPNYLNWSELCKLESFTLKALKGLANVTFNIPLSKKYEFGELCKIMEETAKRRRRLALDLAESIPYQSQVVKFQPGGAPWLEVDRPYFQGGFMSEALTKPYAQLVAVKTWCGDDQVDIKEFVKRLEVRQMKYLLPPNWNQFESKSDMCDFLIERIKYQAKKYQALEFDCADPTIRKRHILNAIDILEWQPIFKNINLEAASKDDLCAIIENYINILLEEKALTIAPGMRYTPSAKSPGTSPKGFTLDTTRGILSPTVSPNNNNNN